MAIHSCLCALLQPSHFLLSVAKSVYILRTSYQQPRLHHTTHISLERASGNAVVVVPLVAPHTDQTEILLRNLDVLTNEEGVLTHLQAVVPQLVGQIAKIQICKDPLTSTSRGVCYVMFDNLVDAMNMHNALHALPTKLNMEARDGA